MDNEKHTVWGTSYEKEMEAMQKAGDSTAPSQMDISSMHELAPNATAANKENIGPKPQPPRCSFALLDDEMSPANHTDRTMLHALPQEHSSTEYSNYSQVFQLKSFVGVQNPPHPSVNATMNDTVVTMLWEDIMSQTKQVPKQISPQTMGNAMDLSADGRTMEISRRDTVLRTRETIYEGHMDMSAKSVIVPRTEQSPDLYQNNVISQQTTKSRNTVYYDLVNAQIEESLLRATIHFNPEDCHLDESNQLPVDNLNHTVTGTKKKTTRETVYYALEEGDMEMSSRGGGGPMMPPPLPTVHATRQTIYYNTPETAPMEESLILPNTVPIVDKENYTPIVVPSGGVAKHRQTIHYQPEEGQMDETISGEEKPIPPPTLMQTRAQKNSRQTIVFHEENGGLDESLQIVSNKGVGDYQQGFTAPAPARSSRQTIHEGADMDESVRHPPHQLPQVPPSKHRQTIHFNPNDGEMDESLQINNQILPTPTMSLQSTNLPRPNAIRQSVYFGADNGQMDLSVAQPRVPPTGRQSVYFGAENGQMDESIAVQPMRSVNKNRQTILFNHNEGQMDESVIQQPVPIKKSRQTIHFNPQEGGMDESLQLSVATPTVTFHDKLIQQQPTMTTGRQSVYFGAEGGAMDESVMVKTPGRSMYHPQEEEDMMEVEEGPQKTPGKRGTIYYQPTEGHMDESRVIPGGQGPAEDHQKSIFIPPPQTKQQKCRQTVYYHPENAGLDETKVNDDSVGHGQHQLMAETSSRPVTRATAAKLRQTIYNPGEMEVSMTLDGARQENRVPEEVMRAMAPQPRRQTVYYQDQNNDLDESGAIPLQKQQKPEVIRTMATPGPQKVIYNDRRGTIHYNPDDGGMEESMVLAKTPKVEPQQRNNVTQNNVISHVNRARQTIHYNNQAEEGGMDETLVPEVVEKKPERRMGPLEMSLRARANKSGGVGNLSVHEILQMSMHEKSRKVSEGDENMEEASVVHRQQQLQWDHNMDESVMKAVVVKETRQSSRQTIYQPVEMEESMRQTAKDQPQCHSRRGTFNIPPEESKIHFQERMSVMAKSNREMDLMESDLNNSEDSIELQDSQDRATRPMSRASQRMSLASPMIQDETVNDLILNFNMTGQNFGQKEEEEEDRKEDQTQVHQLTIAKGTSRIPVAKIARTPRKTVISSENRLDLSTVDTVCRDAGQVMPRCAFGGLEDLNKGEMTFIDGKKQQFQEEIRMSIPAFVDEQINSTKRQTMLEMRELEEDEEVLEDEREFTLKRHGKQSSNWEDHKEVLKAEVPKYRQLDVELLKDLDFEEGREKIKMLRYMVEKATHATPVDQSLYLAGNKTTTEEKGLRDEIMKEIKE